MTITGKDLTKEAPASPSKRVGGYVILPRLTDKCRAMLAGKLGEYHTDCPLDNMLLGFKGVPYAEVKQQLEDGASDEQIAQYLDAHGTPKTPEEIAAWSDSMDKKNPYYDPERKEWFTGVCAEMGLDPATTTMFKWLEEGDKEVSA